MNIEQRQAAADPRTKWTDLGWEFTCRLLLSTLAGEKLGNLIGTRELAPCNCWVPVGGLDAVNHSFSILLYGITLLSVLSILHHRFVLKVAPSGEYLRGHKPRAVDCSCLAPCVTASCLYKTLLLYLACMPVLVVLSCVAACWLCGIDLFSCKAASVFTINLLTYLLLGLLLLFVLPAGPRSQSRNEMWLTGDVKSTWRS